MTSAKDSNKPRVAMFIHKLPPYPVGGSEIQAMLLAKYLSMNDVSVCLVTEGNYKLPKVDLFNNTPVYRIFSVLDFIFLPIIKVLSIGNRKNNKTKIEYDDNKEVTNEVIKKVSIPDFILFLRFFLNSFLFLLKNKHKIDILHVHMMEWPAINVVLLGKIFNKKVIIKDSTMNGVTNILRYPFGRRIQKMLISNSNFVAISRQIEINMRSVGINPEKINYIPNGIEVLEIDKQYRDECRNFIFVGNLYQQPAKGIDILLKAWAKVQKKYTEIHLTIVGDGDVNSYIKFAQSLGIDNRSILFLGKQKDIIPILRNSDAFILPSRREGLSNALLEAMMLGLPCIATNISGSQDAIINNINGLLVPVSNPDALASSIEYFHNNPAIVNHFGKEGKKTVFKLFELNIIALKYKNLYERITVLH